MAGKRDDIVGLLRRIADLKALEKEHDGDIDKVLRWWEARMRLQQKEKQRKRDDFERRQHLKNLLAQIAEKRKSES